MKTLLVATCNKEDTSWLSQVPNVFEGGWIKCVNDTYQPRGREAFVYLDYIAGHYLDLAPKDEMVFCQGNPFSHDPEFLSHLADPNIRYYGEVHSCNGIGMPACDYTPLHSWCDVLNLPKLDEYKFIAGAQYRITGAQIKLHRKEFYEALLYLTMLPGNQSAWVIERLLPQIFELEL